MAPFLMRLEKHVVEAIRKAIEKEYPSSWLFKVHGGPFQVAGIPDIVGCINGRFVAIEVKFPGKENTLTQIQKTMIKKIHRAGAITFMTTSVEHAMSRIKLELDGHKLDPFELLK